MALASLVQGADFLRAVTFLFLGLMLMSVPTAFAQNTLPNPMIPNPMIPNPMTPNSPLPNPMLPSPMGQGLAPLNPLAVNPATREPSTVVLNPDFGNLPDAPGVEDTYYSCTACHSAATFAQQSLTDERWEYLWGWMISDQGMADYGDEAREVILSYLQTHFSSER